MSRGGRGTRSTAYVALVAALSAALGGALLGACGVSVSDPPFGPPSTSGPGGAPRPLDVAGWVDATDGSIPFVIVAPHGGDLTPVDLPDRSCSGCTTVNDANTQALAIEIADAFARRIGRRPFVVINRLHRRKFDANRDRAEATGGHAPLDAMWSLFHARIDSAKARAARVHPRALLIDLHGHGHAIPRLELGYLLSAGSLRLPDSLLTPLVASSSVARLDSATVGGDRGAALVRGSRGLGTRLATAGYPSVPSAQDPAPLVGEEYFEGGYNTQRHGSRTSGPVDAIQVECFNAGVRDTAANRTAFAEALVTAMLAYLADHYGWVPS